MPYNNLQLNPGINTQVSKYASEPTWVFSDKIRWLLGQLRKLGGWQKLNPTPVVGTARGMHAWADLEGNPYLIIGTDQRVEILDGGMLEDVTPLRTTVNITPSFTTTNGSKVVKVTNTANGANTGDWIYIPTQVSVGGLILYGYYQVTIVDNNNYDITAASNATSSVTNGGAVPAFTTTNTSSSVSVALNNHGQTSGGIWPVNVSTAVGGLTLSGSYSITSITDANHFVINAGSAATSTATASENGGNVQIQYLIHSGSANPTTLTGWGGGAWGAGVWGIGGGGQSTTPLRQWFFDYWGQDAIGNPTNGPLYIWMPPYATNPRMVVIPQAPEFMTSIFTAMPEQIIVSLGAETGGTQDPNLVRWCDVGDYTDWTATATNQAGSFRIPTGSHIVGGLQTPLQGIIWTDIDVWNMQYISTPFIFGFTRLGQGCGLIAGRAATVLNGVVYWMGTKQFYAYNGDVQNVPCPVWDYIFLNLNYTYVDKIFAAPNTLYNEIWWFFPSASGNGEVDSYVKYNTLENLWDVGTLPRTAWVDQSVLGPPIGVDTSGYLQSHETGNDDDGNAMISYAITSFSDMSAGEDYQFVDQVLPSFQDISSTANLSLTLSYAKNTGSQVLTKGPYPMTSATQYISTRLRGRFMAIQIGSSDLGSFWQLGSFRYRVAPDGRWG